MERAAEGNAARDEEKECRKDDHDDRHEENEHRGDRLGDGDGEVVGSAEKAQAGKDEEPLGSRRTLAEAVAAEKADRGGAAHLPPCVQEEKKEDKRIGQDAEANRAKIQQRQSGQLRAGEMREHAGGELREQHAEGESRGEGDERGEGGLPEKKRGERAAVHAEDAHEAELLLAAADEEGVRVEKEEEGKHRHHPLAEGHHEADRRGAHAVYAAADGVERGAVGEEGEVVGHRRHKDAGGEVGGVNAPVAAHPAERQTGIEEDIHAAPPPVWDAVSASAMRR